MEQLGIDPKLLLAQIVNFGLIAFLLHKVLFTKVLDMLAKRRKEIDDGLRLSEKMKEEHDALEKKKDKYMDNARKDAQALMVDTRKKAKDEEKTILEHAHAQAEAILEKAKAEAKGYKESVEADVRVQAIDLAAAMVKRVLPEVLSSTDQKKLLEATLKTLKA